MCERVLVCLCVYSFVIVALLLLGCYFILLRYGYSIGTILLLYCYYVTILCCCYVTSLTFLIYGFFSFTCLLFTMLFTMSLLLRYVSGVAMFTMLFSIRYCSNCRVLHISPWYCVVVTSLCVLLLGVIVVLFTMPVSRLSCVILFTIECHSLAVYHVSFMLGLCYLVHC